MKLLLCRKCGDVFSMLTDCMRECLCGASIGGYTDDLNAEYSGPAIPIGFANDSFTGALRRQPKKSPGERFTAFVIERDCPTFRKVKRK